MLKKSELHNVIFQCKTIFLATIVYHRGKQQGYGGGGGGASKRDRPPPSPQPGKLIVRGYPEGTNDDELRALFERFGKLEEGAYFWCFFVNLKWRRLFKFSAHPTEKPENREGLPLSNSVTQKMQRVLSKQWMEQLSVLSATAFELSAANRILGVQGYE